MVTINNNNNGIMIIIKVTVDKTVANSLAEFGTLDTAAVERGHHGGPVD